MYKEMLNNDVTVMVSPRVENFLEYTGVLVEENEETLTLKNVSINYAILNFQKNIFGENINSYKKDIESVIINKKYIISCNKNK